MADSHGACACIEILGQTLGHVLQVARSRGRRFPSRIVIQSDNTEAQANNTTVIVFLAYLVALGYFVSVDNMLLMVERKGEEFKVSWVSSVRDYNAWLNPLQVKLYNAFMSSHGDCTPHSFHNPG